MRMMGIDIIVPAALPVVTVQEFIDHARLNALTVDRQPELIERELAAATERAQAYCRRSLLTQQLRALFVSDGASCACASMMLLPRGPVQSVQAVTNNGLQLPLEAWSYEGAGVVYAAGLTGNTAVKYTAGYGDDPTDVPSMIREGILEYATTVYEARSGGREQKYQASAGRTLPAGVVDLWRPYQVELSG